MTAEHNHPPRCCCHYSTEAITADDVTVCPMCTEHGELAQLAEWKPEYPGQPEPQCPSCHTTAGHPCTDYCRAPKHRTLRITRKDGSEHVILYDAADTEFVESRTWYIQAHSTVAGLFYAYTNQDRASMHALLMGQPGVDHINHNGLDNRRSNLRLATASQNGANRRPDRGGTSQFKGVCWHKGHQKWMAQIKDGPRLRWLGYFDDEVSAAKVYDQAALEAFGDFAFLNFPAAGSAPDSP